jgi:hypothetical protein
MSARITPIRDGKTLTGVLQDELFEVTRKEKYDELTMAQVIGVIEFLKWNLISLSER